MMSPSAATLEEVFATCFADDFKTQLKGGAEEPLYQVQVQGSSAGSYIIHYRHDYFASALHEVAHWCIAGPQRRLQADFGYWYAPEGRDAEQQQFFEAVECKPQALEWFFSRACDYRFQLSSDNLDPDSGRPADTRSFAMAVLQQALQWQRQGLPARAGVFFAALSDEFGTGVKPSLLEFNLAQLQ